MCKRRFPAARGLTGGAYHIVNVVSVHPTEGNKPAAESATEERMAGEKARRLRELMDGERLLLTPCAHDALSAKLIARAGFEAVFVSGFTTSASKGMPDTGLLSYAEMLDTITSVVAGLQGTDVCVFADADTGFGNALNVKRTVRGYAQAGVHGTFNGNISFETS